MAQAQLNYIGHYENISKHDIEDIEAAKIELSTNWNNVKTGSRHKCAVCPKSYAQASNLKYHIRKLHFNLKEYIPYKVKRDLNEVWFERVANTEALIKIQKTGLNKYLMKKVIETDTIRISEEKEFVDLSVTYPIYPKNRRLWCHLCNKTYVRRFFKQHIDKYHKNLTEHKCINCNMTYEDLCTYLKHICSRKDQLKQEKLLHLMTIGD